MYDFADAFVVRAEGCAAGTRKAIDNPEHYEESGISQLSAAHSALASLQNLNNLPKILLQLLANLISNNT